MILALTLLLASTMAAPLAHEGTLILAVDGSRSLSVAELGAAAEHLAETVEALPSDLPVGVIAFHDRAEWRVRPTESRQAIRAALTSIQPEGTQTVLNEALIMASQELPAGGLVLVVSDGRDEGSAVTAGDVERRYSRLDARILTASIGRSVDDRALRRLSLLTQGLDLGTVGAVEPGALATTIESVRQDWLASRISSRTEPLDAPAPSQPSPENPPSVSPLAESATRAVVPTWVVAAGVGIVAFLGLLTMVSAIVRLRPSSESEAGKGNHCPTCGGPLADGENSCAACEIAALEEAARTRQVDTDRNCGAGAAQALSDPGLTMAVADLGYLVLEDQTRPSPRYALPRGESFTVGRAPEVNSLQIDDPTVSAQHFKVVPRDDQFYIVDLDTTNGTTVNHERIRVRRLSPGDVIRAGLCEFRFELSKSTVN